jgi:ribosomal protein S18 acetylase RimI-like enzyme
MPDMAFGIIPMSPADIPIVVRLQTSFLNQSIVTGLGPAFLARFHGAALEHEASRAFVARDADGLMIGFALASVDVDGFNRYVKPRVLTATIRSLLSPARFGLVGRLARMVFEGEPHPPIPAELLLLVVDRQARRRGVGGGLIGAVEETFAAQGIRRYRVAVRSRLDAARAFYVALGFQHEQNRTVLGQPMVYLTKQVGSAGSLAPNNCG